MSKYRKINDLVTKNPKSTWNPNNKFNMEYWLNAHFDYMEKEIKESIKEHIAVCKANVLAWVESVEDSLEEE